jgi:hypothetical protein
METTTTTNGTAAPALSDDDILAKFEVESKARADAAAAAVKAANVEAVKKLAEMREKYPGMELFIAGDDSGGTFRSVCQPPSVEFWKAYQDELKSQAQRPLANRNLIVRCMRWPTFTDLDVATARRPALPLVLANLLGVEAGGGQEGYLKK